MVYCEPKDDTERRSLRLRIPNVEKGTDVVHCLDASTAKSVVNNIQSLHIQCRLNIVTHYEMSDALAGQLAILWVGPRNTNSFRGQFPVDAFEYPPGCVQCGLGSIWNRPHVLSSRVRRCGANFYFALGEPTYIPFMKTDIAERVMKATGVRGCVQHPILKSGDAVKEWMEAVPQLVMPALSPKSKGIMWDKTDAISSVGEPSRRTSPCPACGRRAWADSNKEPRRLVYSKQAIRLANKQGVAWMREPVDIFPTYDTVQKRFTNLYGWPRLLFSLKAVEAMLPYCCLEPIRESTYFEPVFSE